ncbi:hypothetical protein JCM8202_000961 [Rhodotorula sphaerocarpa]
MQAIRTLSRSAPRQARLVAAPQPHLIASFAVAAPVRSRTALFSTSALARKESEEGVVGKESLGGDGPVSARAEGVKQAAKSVAEGAEGVAQKVTGDEQSTFGREAKTPGPDPRNVQEQEHDKGRRDGLARKGDEQGAL